MFSSYSCNKSSKSALRDYIVSKNIKIINRHRQWRRMEAENLRRVQEELEAEEDEEAANEDDDESDDSSDESDCKDSVGKTQQHDEDALQPKVAPTSSAPAQVSMEPDTDEKITLRLRSADGFPEKVIKIHPLCRLRHALEPYAHQRNVNINSLRLFFDDYLSLDATPFSADMENNDVVNICMELCGD